MGPFVVSKILISVFQNIPSTDMSAKSAEEMFSNKSMSLQLIDFGRAIDLKVLPKDIFFTQMVKTVGIKCIEMREGKPWRQHIDYFGLAATAYCLLFGTYIDAVKVGFKPLLELLYILMFALRWVTSGR